MPIYWSQLEVVLHSVVYSTEAGKIVQGIDPQPHVLIVEIHGRKLMRRDRLGFVRKPANNLVDVVQ